MVAKVREAEEGLLEYYSDYVPTTRRAWFYRARRVVEVEAQRGTREMACNRCGKTLDLQVHHIDRDIQNNRSDNLEVLCIDCHLEEHPERLQQLYAVWVDDNGEYLTCTGEEEEA